MLAWLGLEGVEEGDQDEDLLAHDERGDEPSGWSEVASDGVDFGHVGVCEGDPQRRARQAIIQSVGDSDQLNVGLTLP